MSELIIYDSVDNGKVTVRLEGKSLWLTQEQMAELFGRERSVITKHIRNVFREKELEEAAVCANFAHTAGDGKTYQTQHYNLDAIISVGYRVSSKRGTHFRQWATGVLSDHLMQGWTLDRVRFEQNAGELEAALALVRKTAQSSDLLADTGRGLIEIVSRYTRTFLLLQRYDEGLLTDPNGTAGGIMPSLNEESSASRRQQAKRRFPVRRFFKPQQRADARRPACYQRHRPCRIGAAGGRIGTDAKGNDDTADRKHAGRSAVTSHDRPARCLHPGQHFRSKPAAATGRY